MNQLQETKIRLQDLKRRKYKSFDDLLAKANEFATDRDGQLEIVTTWVVKDLCKRSKSVGKSLAKSDLEKKGPRIVLKRKQCSNIRIGEAVDGFDPSSARNDNQMTKKQRTGDDHDDDEEKGSCCKEKGLMTYNDNEASSSSSSSASASKRKRQSTEHKDAYYIYGDEASDLIKMTMKKKMKMQPPLLIDVAPRPELPVEFKERIKFLHGSTPILVIQKEITDTDTKDHQDRLSMPRKKILTEEFLRDQDRCKIDVDRKLDVRVIQPCLEECTLHLSKWDSRTSYCYVLNSGWKHVVSNVNNGIKPGSIIQVWTFRVDENGPIWFALVKL